MLGANCLKWANNGLKVLIPPLMLLIDGMHWYLWFKTTNSCCIAQFMLLHPKIITFFTFFTLITFYAIRRFSQILNRCLWYLQIHLFKLSVILTYGAATITLWSELGSKENVIFCPILRNILHTAPGEKISILKKTII